MRIPIRFAVVIYHDERANQIRRFVVCHNEKRDQIYNFFVNLLKKPTRFAELKQTVKTLPISFVDVC